MKELKIFGFGGHGRIVADIAEEIGYKKILFFDDKPSSNSSFINKDWEYCGNLHDLKKHAGGNLFIAIGNNKVRKNLVRELKSFDFIFPALIDPSAKISKYAKIESGAVVVRGACINLNAKIGEFSIINTNATIGHDVIIQAFCHICPGANIAGNSHISEMTWLGINSTVIQGVRIAASTYLGAGSLVVSDINQANMLMYGAPAHAVRQNDI